VDVTGTAGNNPFYYPLWFGWFITPLSLLPFQTARLIWMLINLGLWFLGLMRLQQLLDFPRPGWRAWLLNLLATFIFAWTTWKFEQTGILLFVILVEVLLAYKKRQWDRMGIFLALALIKPNVMLVPVIAIGAWLLRNKRWRPVLVALAVLSTLVIVTTALTPGWYHPFFQSNFGQGLTEVLDGPNKVTGIRLNTTLPDFLKWFGIQGAVSNITYAAVMLMGAWVLMNNIWKTKSILNMAVVALLVSFAITPYALQYDFPPLIIVLFWTISVIRDAKPTWIPWLLLTFIASVLVWERPISDGYWIVIGLGMLTAWAWKFADGKSLQAEPA
jgi:hypothetical protein